MGDELRHLWSLGTHGQAIALVMDWIHRATHSRITPLVDFGKNLRGYVQGIIAAADFRKLFKSTLNNCLHSNLACVIDKMARSAKLNRTFEELPLRSTPLCLKVSTIKSSKLSDELMASETISTFS